MSDAWNALGWTAQQSATYYTDDGVPGAWNLPADVPTVNVTGTFGEIDGGIARGYVQFAANEVLTHTTTKTTVLLPTFIGRIGRDGKVSMKIPATDATTLVGSPADFAYEVTIVLGRKVFKRFTCFVPKANKDVDVLDLIPTETPIPTDILDIDGGTA